MARYLFSDVRTFMAIQWFPGHMNKARRKISEAMPTIDLVIEVLDARLPYSSRNPLVDELRQDTPVIKVLNKADLADPATTDAWLSYYSEQDNVSAIAMIAEDKKQVRRLITVCKTVGQNRTDRKQAIRVMIMGIPNVGKSTLINSLAGKYIAKTGNEPAVTKANQLIDLKNGIVLSDTPGILWPRFENEAGGYRLAASGAVKDTAIEYTDVANFAGRFLLDRYNHAFLNRYKFKTQPAANELLTELGRKRGCLRPGGIVDTHKAAEILLHEMRSGKLGRISFETPKDIEAELAVIAEQKRLKELAEQEAREKAEQQANSNYRRPNRDE